MPEKKKLMKAAARAGKGSKPSGRGKKGGKRKTGGKG
jgi:hypothetical protein